MRPALEWGLEGRVLSDSLAARLRKAILDGYFQPGERLDQDRIAGDLRVSRTPLREALRTLESEGFVEIHPHRGAFVTMISLQQLREIYEVRALLEPQILRKSGSQISPETLDGLEAPLSNALERLAAEGDWVLFEEDTHFHHVLASLSENTLLKGMVQDLNTRANMVRHFAQQRTAHHPEEAIREHKAILAALRYGEPERAAEQMARHLRQAVLRLQEMLQG